MKSVIILFFLLASQVAHASECVILLHGLIRSASSMERLEARLVNEGYHVANIDYPSTKYEVETLSTLAVSQGLKQCSEYSPTKIHFVTHSLGGILVRDYLHDHGIPNLGRTVMLGPPNGGSEVVDKLKSFPGFKFMNGPAGMQLGTNADSVPNSLGPANFEVGIISGTRSINLILSMLIPDEDDGKVSVKNAHLKNEKDFLSLPVTHTFIMKNKRVIDNVVAFLKQGHFIQSAM